MFVLLTTLFKQLTIVAGRDDSELSSQCCRHIGKALVVHVITAVRDVAVVLHYTYKCYVP